jgi:hypothetical protein
VLPLFLALVMLVFQVAIVGRDEVRVVHAARVAVRAAAVTSDRSQIRAAATSALPGAHLQLVQRGPVGTNVTVVVSYTSPTNLPVIGALLPDIHLHARAVMQVER